MINHLAELAGARGLEGFQIQVQNAMPGMDMSGQMPIGQVPGMSVPQQMPPMGEMPAAANMGDGAMAPEFVTQLGGGEA
jgi:hypothetical protein